MQRLHRTTELTAALGDAGVTYFGLYHIDMLPMLAKNDLFTVLLAASVSGMQLTVNNQSANYG